MVSDLFFLQVFNSFACVHVIDCHTSWLTGLLFRDMMLYEKEPSVSCYCIGVVMYSSELCGDTCMLYIMCMYTSSWVN